MFNLYVRKYLTKSDASRHQADLKHSQLSSLPKYRHRKPFFRCLILKCGCTRQVFSLSFIFYCPNFPKKLELVSKDKRH